MGMSRHTVLYACMYLIRRQNGEGGRRCFALMLLLHTLNTERTYVLISWYRNFGISVDRNHWHSHTHSHTHTHTNYN